MFKLSHYPELVTIFSGLTGSALRTKMYGRDGEPICCHGPQYLRIIAGRPQIKPDFILKFYLYPTMRTEASCDILSQVPAHHGASF